jgi:hypothetical protein
MHQEYISSEETLATSAVGTPVYNQHDAHKLLIEGVKEVVGNSWSGLAKIALVHFQAR